MVQAATLSRTEYAARDFREAIEQTEAAGELIRVATETDPKLEIPAVTVALMDRVPSPALLFEQIAGYPGWRALCGLFSSYDRVCRMVGASADRATNKAWFLRALDNPISPRVVSTGPCKETIVLSPPDITGLVPPTHAADKVRQLYYHMLVFSRHPETGERNTGIYRIAVQGPDKVSVCAPFEQHMGMQLSATMERGVTMPVALCAGASPAVYVAAGTKLMYGQDELEYAGGMLGQPIDMVKCETSDLLVPANSEVVIEGEFRPPYEFGRDGPHPEYLRYYGSEVDVPIMHVTAVTYRKDPIHFIASPGGIPHNGAAATQAVLLRYLRQVAGEFVVDSFITPKAIQHHVIVKVKKRRRQDEGRQINAAMAAFAFSHLIHKVTLVDDDVNIYDLGEVDWAIATRCDPTKQVHILPAGRSFQGIPISDVKETLGEAAVQGNWIVDATIPWRYRNVPKGEGISYFDRSVWPRVDLKRFLSGADQERWKA